MCVLLHDLRANTAVLLRARKHLDPLCSIITSFAPSCNIRTRYSRVLPCFIAFALRSLLRCTWELHLGGQNAEILCGDSLNFFCKFRVAVLGYMRRASRAHNQTEYTGSIAKVGRQGKEFPNGLQTVDKRRTLSKALGAVCSAFTWIKDICRQTHTYRSASPQHNLAPRRSPWSTL